MSRMFFPDSEPLRHHCGSVIAFEVNGELYIHCRRCKEWHKVEDLRRKKTAPGHPEGQESGLDDETI